MKYKISFDIELKTHSYAGKFIVIEGIDGSGKTTQAEKLVGVLREKGVKAIYTKEPTDEPTGQVIRSEILSGKTKIPGVAVQYLMAADRAVHHEKIEQYLKEGYTVISDRYFWSAIAYGLVDKGINFEQNGQLLLTSLSILSMYHQFIAPDITFYLNVSTNTAMQRIKRKKTRIEIYEKKEKLDKISKGYNWIAKQFPEEFVVVDGERSVDDVQNEIIERIN